MPVLPLNQVSDHILDDPSIYPQNLNLARESILFVRLAQSAIRDASFLDDRILTAQSEGRWVNYAELAPWLADAALQHPLHFIFHTGHVGSTLVSRLLDETGEVLGLREPLPLRVLAEVFDQVGAPHALVTHERAQALLGWLLVLWSRGYADTKSVIVKATSSAGRLAPNLLQALPTARALYLNLRAEPYLATLLAGENSHLDLRGHGPERQKRLARQSGAMLAPYEVLSLGELAAFSWLAETMTQQHAARECGVRLLPMDFDALLKTPVEAMRTICAHFALDPSRHFFDTLPESPVMMRYSKAPDQPYGTALRDRILAESRTRNSEEIRKGLAWLEAMARQSPSVAQALSA